MEILQRLGANAVRAHYALPELFLDFCDQYGFLFMAEAPAWQYSAQQLAEPEIQEKILNHLRGMIARDMNHPSIHHLEPGERVAGAGPVLRRCRGAWSSRRGSSTRTRLITLVTGGPRVWRVHELLDVICVNWARYQWYDPFTVLDREGG